MKSIRILIAVVLMVGIGVFVFTKNQSAPEVSSSPTPVATISVSKTPGASVSPTASGYTAAQVATHNSKASCWSIIRGGVYDLTNWIGQHPGGQQAIVAICGKDGTAAFEVKHAGSAQQEALLPTMKIGVLVQ